ncbi:transposase [Protofrankia symbiont of Coriaria ruscifolia]|uniref:transposase n=1 Tax=Protofrankia symbiont of Coriaria ruscifolia TaxID=1306542 RepID=UPI0013EFB6EE|nr:transposase [Protofrankia symbiont of Coriaria ruscifolia]
MTAVDRLPAALDALGAGAIDLGRDHGTDISVEIGVFISAATLAGVTDTPGELAGYGPIPAATARELAKEATWRRILTDPTTGAPVDIGRRFPAPGLARLLRTRERTCRFPGCQKPARFCDLDHVQPYANGGKTTEGNLLTLCRRHHRAKHNGGWTVRRAAGAVVTWTAPTRQVYLCTDPCSRRRTIPKGQLALALGGQLDHVWAVSFIVTNIPADDGPGIVTVEAWFRGRADIETRIKEAKLGAGLRHLPSAEPAVNAVWMGAALLAGLLSVMLQSLAGIDGDLGRAHADRLRHELLRVPARILRHARGVTLRLPPGLHELLPAVLTRLNALPAGP